MTGPPFYILRTVQAIERNNGEDRGDINKKGISREIFKKKDRNRGK
jgi:hypothetical protein